MLLKILRITIMLIAEFLYFISEHIVFCVKKKDINLFIFLLDLFKSVNERFGCLDIVCNNAGVGGEVYPLWERTVDVNVVKNVHVLHVLFKLLFSMEPNI